MGNHENPFDRRKFLQKMSAAGIGISAFGGTAVAENDTKSDINVTNANVIEGEELSTRLGPAMRANGNESIKRHLIQEFDLRPSPSDTLGFAIQTDDPEWNNRSPTLLMVPFAAKGNNSGRGAFLNTLVVESDGSQVPIASFALSAELTGANQSNLSTDTSSRTRFTTFGVDGDEVVTLDETIRSATGDIGTQAEISCTTCGAIAGEICRRGVASVGLDACVAICLPLSATVVGAVACAAACDIILQAAAFVGCAYGGAEICEETPFC